MTSSMRASNGCPHVARRSRRKSFRTNEFKCGSGGWLCDVPYRPSVRQAQVVTRGDGYGISRIDGADTEPEIPQKVRFFRTLNRTFRDRVLSLYKP
jgi:hypothetical protein